MKIESLATWQTSVGIQALIGWLLVQGFPGPAKDYFFYFFKHTLNILGPSGIQALPLPGT